MLLNSMLHVYSAFNYILGNILISEFANLWATYFKLLYPVVPQKNQFYSISEIQLLAKEGWGQGVKG